MPSLPDSNCSLLVRTDFSDDAAWLAVSTAAEAESDEGFQAHVEPIDDRQLEGAPWQSLREAVPENVNGASVLFLVDSITIAALEAPILVVDLVQFRLHGTLLEPFRCIPSELWSVENNLNIANMDWESFADNVHSDGVFRGF